MNVLIPGATGFVGQELLLRVNQAGHTARILARDPISPAVRKLVPELAKQLHTGDVTKPESLKDALDGIDAVIHLVGIIGELGENTFENVHTRGTQNIL